MGYLGNTSIGNEQRVAMETKSNNSNSMKIALIISSTLNIVFIALIIRYKLNYRLKRKNEFNIHLEKKVQSGADLFADITKSEHFFREIKREIHPDKFIDNPELQAYAQQKMKEAGENQHSFSHLTSIIKEMQAEGFEFSERFMNEFRKH
jgi:hypothetical protein